MTKAVRDAVNTNESLVEFQRRIETKYGISFESYWDLHGWSVANYDKFWEEVWIYLDIIHSEAYTEVVEMGKSIDEIPEWFSGSKLNYAENLLRHPREKPALILRGEGQQGSETVTYGQLIDEVSLISSALRKAGVKPGDIIAGYISNRKESITIMLAAAATGAIYSATNTLMAIPALANRLELLRPKVLFIVDRHLFNKHEFEVLGHLPQLVKGQPSLELVVIVPSNQHSLKRDISGVPRSIFMSEFLTSAVPPEGPIPPPLYEHLPYSHPFIVNFTSGTTGQPKGIVHSLGACLLGPLKDLRFCANVKPSDVLFTFYGTGWVSWNFFVCALAVGSTLIVYEGLPFYHYGTEFWDILDEHGVTYAFINPVVLEDMEKNPHLCPGPHNQLQTLHTIVSGSCHVKSHTYDFVYNSIKPDVFFSTIYGSTEYMMAVGGLNHNLPVYKGEIQVPCLGAELLCYNEAGQKVCDETGELILGTPFATMPLFFWKDDGNKKYHSAFFEKYPGVWCHGDTCKISAQTGGIAVFGRSDETVVQREVRFNSTEIYSVVNQMPEVNDSLCVTRIDKNGDELAVLFIKMRGGCKFTPEFVAKVTKIIEEERSLEYVPESILPIKDIPYNVNGKRMEILVKKILAKHKVPFDAVSNMECLQEYIDISNAFSS